MTQRDYTSAVRTASGNGQQERIKHNIGHVDGRVAQEKSTWFRVKKTANRILEDGLPTIVRDNCCKIFGIGIGNFIADTILSGFDRIGYGNANKNHSGNTPYYASYQSSFPQYRTQPVAQTRPSLSPEMLNWQDVTTMRAQSMASDLLARMQKGIADNGSVSVAELFDAVGLDDEYTYNWYGWTNLDGVQIRRNNIGWYIDLPRPVSIVNH